MKFALISLGVFFIASLLFLGEAAWLILLCLGVGRVAFGSSPRGLRAAVVVVGVGILGAHFAGYKLYGGATIHDNLPVLDAPHELAALVAPNIVMGKDGSRFEVSGVTFTPEVLSLPVETLSRALGRSSGPVFIQSDAASPSGVVFQRHCNYWCGNTFFPTFLPRRLPAYTKADIGYYLAAAGLATADSRVREGDGTW